MKKFYSAFLSAALALLISGCGSSVIPQRTGAPGKVVVLPEKSGMKSLPFGGFTALGDLWPSEQTEATVTKIVRDGKPALLRFEIVCYGDTSILEWSGKKADDDMTLFNGEHVELLAAPYGVNEGGIYYHIALNPAGSIYHAKIRDTKWNLNTKPVIRILKDRWIAVIDLPETLSLSVKTDTPAVWNFNIARTIRKKGKAPEHSSWTGASNFHDITTMGQLHFSGEQPVDQLRVLKCSINDESELELEVAKTGKGHAFLQVFDHDDFVASQRLAGTDPVKLKFKLKKKYIVLKERKTISLYLLGPYRIPLQKFSGNVFACKNSFLSLDKQEYIGEKEMICKVHLIPGKAVIRNDKTVIREQEITENTAKISLEGLKPGRYVLDYNSQGKRSSRVFFIAPDPLQKVAVIPEKGKLSIKGNELLMDGKPFYLLGISGGSKTHFSHPAEFSLLYGKGYRKNALIYRGFPGKRLVRQPVTGYAFSKNWENMIANHLQKMKKSEKPAWNTLCYEANLAVLFTNPDGSLRVDPEGHKVYKQIYDMAKKELPDSVLSIQVDNILLAQNYIGSCDALEYAVYSSSYHPTDMIKNLGRDFDKLRNLAGTKPLIPWLGGTIPSPESRSAEEVRAGVYYTILKGGAGNIIHMGHGGMPKERTRFWSMLSMLSREVESFYSDFRTWQEIKFNVPEKFVGRAVKGPNGELLAVLLNTTESEIQTEIEFPGFGKHLLTFTPYEPRVFRMGEIKKKETIEKPVTEEKKEVSAKAETPAKEKAEAKQ